MSRPDAQAFLGMARESLRAAQLESGADLQRNALASAYFAAHQAARALLATQGIAARTHRGTLKLLREHFTGDGGLPKDLQAWLSRLQDLRESSHYDWSFQPSKEQVEAALASSERFVAEVARLVDASGD